MKKLIIMFLIFMSCASQTTPTVLHAPDTWGGSHACNVISTTEDGDFTCEILRDSIKYICGGNFSNMEKIDLEKDCRIEILK